MAYPKNYNQIDNVGCLYDISRNVRQSIYINQNRELIYLD